MIQSESFTLRVISVLGFLGVNEGIRTDALRINAEKYAHADSRGNEGSRNSPPHTAMHEHTGQSSPEHS